MGYTGVDIFICHDAFVYIRTHYSVQRSHSRGRRRLATIEEAVFPYEEASSPQPRRLPRRAKNGK